MRPGNNKAATAVGLCALLCVITVLASRDRSVSLLAYLSGAPSERLIVENPSSSLGYPKNGAESLRLLSPVDTEIARSEAHARLIQEEANLVRATTLAKKEESSFGHRNFKGTTIAEQGLLHRAKRLTRLADQVEEEDSAVDSAQAYGQYAAAAAAQNIVPVVPPPVESGVQINLNVNKEKPEGGVNINLNVNNKDTSTQEGGQRLRESHTQGSQILRESHTEGGQSLSEGDMLRGEKLLAQLQNSASQTQAHAARHTRVAQQKHDIHKKAHAGPMLHFTSKIIPAAGKVASKKVENFNFKGFGIDLAGRMTWSPGPQAWYAYAEQPAPSSAARATPFVTTFLCSAVILLTAFAHTA